MLITLEDCDRVAQELASVEECVHKERAQHELTRRENVALKMDIEKLKLSHEQLEQFKRESMLRMEDQRKQVSQFREEIEYRYDYSMCIVYKR
mmetsp:Transcript_20713/g.33742  ORF Transcript_20713/g.33742 Transcript_20713/m.33742 type:complete len:93 (-) Transcript_20713:63-341(-)